MTFHNHLSIWLAIPSIGFIIGCCYLKWLFRRTRTQPPEHLRFDFVAPSVLGVVVRSAFTSVFRVGMVITAIDGGFIRFEDPPPPPEPEPPRVIEIRPPEDPYMFTNIELANLVHCMTFYISNVPVSGEVHESFVRITKKLSARAEYLKKEETIAEKSKIRRIRV